MQLEDNFSFTHRAMIFFGNILLVVAALIAFGVSRLQLGGMPSGDRGVGHAIGLLAGTGALVVLLVSVTAILASSGRLPAYSLTASHRTGSAILFVAGVSIASAFLVVAAPSGAPEPWSFNALLRVAPLLALIVLVATMAFLLNSAPKSGAPSIGTSAGLIVAALPLLAGIVVAAAPGFISRVQLAKEMSARGPDALDSNDARILADINAADSTGGFMTFVSFSRAGRNPQLRARALERLHAIPDWESRLVERLDSYEAADVIAFLISNDVSDPNLFAPVIEKGIRQEAQVVRDRIRSASHPSHIRDDLMVFEVENTLQAVARFSTFYTGYVPAIRELRSAFDEKSEFPQPKYQSAKLLDRWLKDRQ